MFTFDVEADGLLDSATKIHVLSFTTGKEVISTYCYEEMKAFFLSADVLVGHNIVRYDIPLVEKILGIKVKARLIDTLALSWYLNHNRTRHGLEFYGIDYGILKPMITDWENLSPSDYAFRCEEDVRINQRLWLDLSYKLGRLYKDPKDLDRLVDYLTFKMECAREQEAIGWKLDVEKAKSHLDQLTAMKEDKTDQLAAAMPRKVIYKRANQPKQMYLKDGSLSSRGEAWLALLKQHGQRDTTIFVNLVDREELANPNSNDQVKDWLFSLGWKPATWKFVRDKDTGQERKIEQVRDDGELCASVKMLAQVDPTVDILDGLTVINHRLGIFKSFVDCEKGGYVKAEIAGLTNTLRFKHSRPLVNLPSVEKPWGKEIRGCLTAPDGYVLCGADMTSLEDTTKRHYMQPLDPAYVFEMSQDGFDPHLDLAKHAGRVTEEDIARHNKGEIDLKPLRKNFKVVNYSATYGVGANKLSRTTGMNPSEAATLLEAFWSRNWAVTEVANRCEVRVVADQQWLRNPVSGFYHSLRADKDRFSTLNQSTGVYCFDRWVSCCRRSGLQMIGQFHDEVIALVKLGDEATTKATMENSIKKVNEATNLNVPLGIDANFGKDYAEIH